MSHALQLPVNDWLIRCIATVRHLEICCQIFVATMACRFIEADDELIELLKCESEIKNTKRSTGYWKGILEKCQAKTRGKEEQLESSFFKDYVRAASSHML